MVNLDDLYNIATAMDEQMLLMNSKHKKDFRKGLLISLEIPQLDLQGIDETLYFKENNTMVGYEKCDEIKVNVLGINFLLTKKESE
jgi:hypothetical protein